MTNLWVTTDELGTTYSTSEYAEDAIRTASYLLWGMSGRKYTGTTTVSERYITSINALRYQGTSAKNFYPHLVAGDVYNVPTEDWTDSAYQSDGTSSLSRIRLRGKPVHQVHLVRSLYDGKIVSPDKYYVAEHSSLIAYQGTPWPPGNIEVTYSYGALPPAAGRQAAKLLAIELIKLWSGSDDCMLPQRVTSVSRQGVSFTILDNQEFLNELRVGIYAVDLFLKVANPMKSLMPARVWNPDLPRARRAAPSRPLVLSANTANDVELKKSNDWTVSKTYTASGSLASLATYNDPAYELQLVAYSNAGSVYKIYPSTAASFRVVGGVTYVDLEFTYDTAYKAVGPSDPGTWTLRAVEIATSASTDLLEGNLKIVKVTTGEIHRQDTRRDNFASFTCIQGSTFTKTLRWSLNGVVQDITGYTAAMQVRTTFGAATALVSLTSQVGADKVVSSAVVASNVLTVTTSTDHDFTVGDVVTLTNVITATSELKYRVASVPTATTFTIAYTADNGALTLGSSPTANIAQSLTLGGTLGTIVISLSDETTTRFATGTYVYDLELTSSVGDVTQLVQGTFIVKPEVTTI